MASAGTPVDGTLMATLRAVLAVAVVALPPSVRAEEADIVHRLMDEPVSLFDWGLANLDRDVERAANHMIPRTLGSIAGKSMTGVIYDWRERAITVFVSVTLPKVRRTAGGCAAVFDAVVLDMTRGGPAGASAAGWYLKNAFKPAAHFWGDRFEDVGAKLLDVVSLEVQLLPAAFEAMKGDTLRVRCAGRLDADRTEIKVEIMS